MTQNVRPTGTGLEAAVALHGKQLRELLRTPGQWITVGVYPGDVGTVPESPPFENGWTNVGGTRAPFSFRLDKWRNVHLRGAVTGGAVGTVITTLPESYRPEYTQEFIVSAGAGDRFATLEVGFNGQVKLVALSL